MAFTLLTAFVLGFLHSFDVDHIVALTGMVARRPSPLRALGMGISWGIGHTGTILLMGLAAVGLRVIVPEQFSQWGEILVGVVLVLIGLAVLRDRRPMSEEHLHQHADGTVHAHGHHGHVHDHRGHVHLHGQSVLVGMVHGLAGTAGVLVLIPVALMSQLWQIPVYVLVFGLGTVISMGGYACLVAVLVRRTSFRPALFRAVRMACGAASLVLGAVWIAQRFVAFT